jgi:hypothetical protein
MRKRSWVRACAATCVAAVVCCGGNEPSEQRVVSPEVAFSDGTWVLSVDRSLRTGVSAVGFPSDTLPESAYAAVSDGPRYTLVVTDGASRVVVQETGMAGGLEKRQGGLFWFELTGGRPAGGRLLVWAAESELQGEVTLYGSGLPVIRSERGRLQR